ncbi:MAG: hypothetical protein ABIP17_10980 [Ilumatobacteraceae bacterium]
MAVLGAVSLLSLRVGSGRMSGLIGLMSGVSAAPGLLLAGAPFADGSRYPLAVLGSIPLWLLLGLLASRRATSQPVANWTDYWRELMWLTLGVVVGACAALIAASLILSESLIV